MYELTLSEQLSALARGEISSVALTQLALSRLQASQALINSAISIDADSALQAAQAADLRRAKGQAGALEGVPIGIKDIFCTQNLPTTCGSKMLENFVPPYDATVVRHLRNAGAVLLGKLNMDEFAMGSSNENSYFGAVKNPWDTRRVPGGSSGGSAAAVAARALPAALGTDTGGSIRQPAALCGITGLKPTYGRVSRYGMIAFASSLDQGGPMAQSAEDCAQILSVIAGADPLDSTSVDRETDDYIGALQQSIQGLRIGVPQEYFGEGLSDGVRKVVEAALQRFVEAGATLVPISLPNQHLALPAYYVVAPAEASSNLSRYDGVRFGHRCADPVDLEDLYRRSRDEGFGEEVKRRIIVGTYVLSEGYYDAYYNQALKLRRLISEDFTQAFAKVDVIAGPATPTTAFELGSASDNPVSMYLNDIYTVTANLAGLPGISLPCGFSEELPVGLQLLAPHFQEARLLGAAHQYQQLTHWHRQMPTMAKEL